MLDHAELDRMNLGDLADRLAQVRATRTNKGFGTENAVQKASLERRIMEKVTSPSSTDPSKLVVDHEIALSVHNSKLEAPSAEIRGGGLFIPGRSSFKPGMPGVVEIRTDNDYRLRVKCIVRDTSGEEQGVSVGFESLDDGSQRRVSRLILELLKNQA